MNVLLVSQAKYGVKNVIQGVAPQLARRHDTNIEYLTIPINEPPSGCKRTSLLNERLVRALDGRGVSYLGYAVLNFWRRAYKHIQRRTDDFDVIWLHNPRLLPLAPGSISDNLLVTYHSHLQHKKAEFYGFPHHHYYRAFGRIEKWGIRKHSDARYTAVNPEVIQQFQEIGIEQDLTTCIANGVDIDKFGTGDSVDLREEWGLPDGTILLSVGRLAPVKRPITLLKTYRRLSKYYSEPLSLVLVGDGVLRNEVEEYISKHNLEDVKLLGFVEPNKIPELYTAADYFVLSTQYDPGGPLTLYEALASELPCIVPDLPNMGFIAEKSCGKIVDFEYPDDAAEQIASYLKSQESTHGENAREYAEEHLSWERRAEEYYEELHLTAR